MSTTPPTMTLHELSAMACFWQNCTDSVHGCCNYPLRDDIPTLEQATSRSRRSEEPSPSPDAAVAAPVTGRLGNIEQKYFVYPHVLGAGRCSSVRECVEFSSGRPHAIKSFLKSDPLVDPSSLARELSLLQRMNHPNIIRFADVYEDNMWLHITTDLCSGGELFDKIVEKATDPSNHAKCFPDDEAARILHQILSAVSYMHGNHIAHRDIKPENVLFETREEGSAVKLIDFSLARRHFEGMEPMMSTIVGTPYYVAPEVLLRRHTKSADLWSVGVTAYVMLCGYPPFNGRDDDEVYDAIREGTYRFPSRDWSGTTRESRDFVRRLLVDPRGRMTAGRALVHPWMAQRAMM